jgi:hypothetical protein
MGEKAGGGRKHRKHGRSKRNGQAARYLNERRAEQNQLRRLKKYVAVRGVTGADVLAAIHRCQDVLGIKRSDLKVAA